jgi:hypothetical protein
VIYFLQNFLEVEIQVEYFQIRLKQVLENQLHHLNHLILQRLLELVDYPLLHYHLPLMLYLKKLSLILVFHNHLHYHLLHHLL